MAPAQEILLVGHPALRSVARPVGDPRTDEARAAREVLHHALRAFRESHGFGRAVAAPQLDLPLRMVAVDLGDGPFTLHDPELVARSRTTFTLWDDCMSFPDLLVRVRRHTSVTLAFTDESGTRCELADLEPARSELFQHELDHLDGVLALDRALDRDSIVHRRVFEADPAAFQARVDGLQAAGEAKRDSE